MKHKNTSNPTVPSYALSNGELFLPSTVQSSPSLIPSISIFICCPHLFLGKVRGSTSTERVHDNAYHHRPSSFVPTKCVYRPTYCTFASIYYGPYYCTHNLRYLLRCNAPSCSSLPTYYCLRPPTLLPLCTHLRFYCTFAPSFPISVPIPSHPTVPSHLLYPRFYCTFPPLPPFHIFCLRLGHDADGDADIVGRLRSN